MRNEKPTVESYLLGCYLLLSTMFSGQPSLIVIPYVPISLMFLYVVIKRIRLNQPVPIALKLYLGFGVWAFLSHLWIGPFEIKYGGFIFLILTILITLLNSQLFKSKADLFNILFIYSLSVIPIILMNITDIQKSLALTYSTGGGRFYGTFGNANTAGLYGVSVIWAICYLIFQSDLTKLRKIFLATLLPFAFQLVLISGSRKAYVGICVLAIFLYYVSIKKFDKNIIFKVVSAAALGIGFFFVFQVFSNSVFYFRFEKLLSGDKESVEDRSQLMTKAIDVWEDHPLFGVGFDSFRYHNNDEMPSHSSVTETLVSTGIIGFLLYFSALVAIFILFYNANRRKSLIRDPVLKRDIQFYLVFLLLFIFFNTSAILYNSREMWPILGLLYVYVLRISIMAKNKRFSKLTLSK
jgi:O-antigen ligase